MPTTSRPLSLRPALAALMALACGAWLPAQAQSDAGADWKPRKSTEFIVPSGAGAALDVAARKLTELLTREKLAPGFIVSNKSSAHGIVALEGLHRHPGDAHALMTLSTSYGNSLAQNALPDHLQKGTPLATLFREFVTVVVRADSPLRAATSRAAPAPLGTMNSVDLRGFQSAPASLCACAGSQAPQARAMSAARNRCGQIGRAHV